MFRPSVSIPSSPSLERVGRVSVMKDPSYIPGPSDYVGAMMKYNIGGTHPGAFQYEKLISRLNRGLRRRNSLGQVDAQLTPGPLFIGYRSPIVLGEGDNAQTFFVMLDTGSTEFWVF
jgi:hypothetical protein